MSDTNKSPWLFCGSVDYYVIRNLLFAFVIFAGCILSPQHVCSQQGYRRLPPPRKKNALDSLSDLHRKVKSSLFGRGARSAEEREDYRSYDQHSRPNYDRSYVDGRDFQRHAVDEHLRRPYDSHRLPPHHADHAQYQQPIERYASRDRAYDNRQDNESYPDQQYRRKLMRESVADQRRRESDRELRASSEQRNRLAQNIQSAESFPTQHDSHPAAIDANQYAQQPPHRGESYGARSANDYGQAFAPPEFGHAPPPPYYGAEPYITAPENSLRDHSFQNHSHSQNNEYRTGHYRNGDGLSVEQFDQQATATQRVLALQRENRELIDTRKSMTSENQRLMKLVQEKDRLLEQIEKAIEDARKELLHAKENNEELKRRISRLESEKEDQLLASTRQMDAIRKQLDDVLMREISGE